MPDEPEYGVVASLDADYRGTPGVYALAYGIEQESAVNISKDMNGQPKFLAEIEYYRVGDAVRARCSHHGYTFLEFTGKTTGPAPLPGGFTDRDYWIKVSRAVGHVEKSYDFPPHVVVVKADYQPVHRVDVKGELRLRESPWDPIAELRWDHCIITPMGCWQLRIRQELDSVVYSVARCRPTLE